MKSIHLTPKYFKNPTHKITICVIGCGGTGSSLLPRLALLNQTLLQLGHVGIDLVCFDDDSVEEHNIGRQRFTKQDLGKNKAMQLISKINLAYGFDWRFFKRKLELDNDEVPKYNIVITCVDTVDVRMKIDKGAKIERYGFFNDYSRPYYWIDCGNGKDFGQVVLGTLNEIEQPIVNNYKTHSTLKNVVDIYGDLSAYESEDTQGIESCSVFDSLLKQDLFINDEIALNAAKIVHKLLTQQYIKITGYIVNQDIGKTQAMKLE